MAGISTLRKYADIVNDFGRKGDTMVAHITPREAKILKSYGGSGSRNPYTGLLEFFGASPSGGAANAGGPGGLGGPGAGSSSDRGGGGDIGHPGGRGDPTDPGTPSNGPHGGMGYGPSSPGFGADQPGLGLGMMDLSKSKSSGFNFGGMVENLGKNAVTRAAQVGLAQLGAPAVAQGLGGFLGMAVDDLAQGIMGPNQGPMGLPESAVQSPNPSLDQSEVEDMINAFMGPVGMPNTRAMREAARFGGNAITGAIEGVTGLEAEKSVGSREDPSMAPSSPVGGGDVERPIRGSQVPPDARQLASAFPSANRAGMAGGSGVSNGNPYSPSSTGIGGVSPIHSGTAEGGEKLESDYAKSLREQFFKGHLTQGELLRLLNSNYLTGIGYTV